MRYEFTEHYDREGWYIVTDTKWMIVCEFQAHRFNETQNFIDFGYLPADPDKVAHAMSELGDWLFSHHYAEVLPAPTFELKRSDDDSEILIIRHKAPHLMVSIPENEVNDLNEIACTLEKMAQFLRKRVQKYSK